MSKQSFFADSVWMASGWCDLVRIDIDQGRVSATAAGQPRGEAQSLGRYVLPGMPNLHSHAFQRAMAGLTERRQSDAPSRGEDNFWTWRETIYAFAGRIGPDDLHAIAAQVYVEMLKAGYTHVCEFHYLHHQPNGMPYADPAAMSLALIEAARETGIGLTLLPVLYMTGGFDGRALSDRQRRFGFDIDGYLRLLDRLRGSENNRLHVGVALHSLRAVPLEGMRQVLESAVVTGTPIHIHIAEQIGEVQDCLSLRNARPVEWLLDHAQVDANWCLVHATHVTADEVRRVAASGAVAGLCPTTEANLGDGLFALKPYLQAGGRFGIGSDSNISISPVEELRWLEYGQRLTTHHRNVALRGSHGSVGETLWAGALAGGAQASAMPIGRLDADAGQARADLLVLDADAPILAARQTSNLVDTLIFSGNVNLVRDVMVSGEWVVRDFRHRDEERIAGRYRDTVQRLAQAL